MNEFTISQVSKNYNISTRMLRYYEKEGLIKSFRKDDYAYRMFDDKSINKIQIIILFKEASYITCTNKNNSK